MDPRKTVQRFIEAVADDDLDEAAAAAQDLVHWLEDGGYSPTVPRDEYIKLWAAIAGISAHAADCD